MCCAARSYGNWQYGTLCAFRTLEWLIIHLLVGSFVLQGDVKSALKFSLSIFDVKMLMLRSVTEIVDNNGYELSIKCSWWNNTGLLNHESKTSYWYQSIEKSFAWLNNLGYHLSGWAKTKFTPDDCPCDSKKMSHQDARNKLWWWQCFSCESRQVLAGL